MALGSEVVKRVELLVGLHHVYLKKKPLCEPFSMHI